MSWSDLDLRIIHLIKNDYPMLYKQKLAYYNNPDIRRAWDSLASNLNGVSGQICKIRWHNIQNHYFQIKNAIKDGKQYLIDMKSKYLDGTLSFLDSEIEHPESPKTNSDLPEKINIEDDTQPSTSIQALVENPQSSKEDLTLLKDDDRLVLQEIAMDLLKFVDNKHEIITETAQESDIETLVFIKPESPEDCGNIIDLEDAVTTLQNLGEAKKYEKKPETDNTSNTSSDPKSILDLNCYEPDNKKFYDELSDYVVSRFSLQNQREIRLRICSMLKNSDVTFPKDEV